MAISLVVKLFTDHGTESVSSSIDFDNNVMYTFSKFRALKVDTVGFICDWCRSEIAIKGNGEAMSLTMIC